MPCDDPNAQLRLRRIDDRIGPSLRREDQAKLLLQVACK
jgi:hypothetical protein